MKKFTIIGILLCSTFLVACSNKSVNSKTKSDTKTESISKKESSYTIAKKLDLKKFDTSNNTGSESKIVEVSEKNAEKLLSAGYVQVPKTKGLSKDEVSDNLESLGIKAKFVKKVNWNEMGGAEVAKDMCWSSTGGINLGQYVSYLYGNNEENWIKTGETLIVPYADKYYPASTENNE